MLTGYGGSFPDEASKNAINRHPSPELFQTSVADSEILYEAEDYTHLPAPSLKTPPPANRPARRKKPLSGTDHSDACLSPGTEAVLPTSQKHRHSSRNRNYGQE